ncbi:uncharacterized protein LOC144169707 isoform X4 [Haemaphysalis longicornis]
MQKMSGVQKAPGGIELKPPDKGEQPMDLAPRTAHQHVVAAAVAGKPTQLQVTTIGPSLRPHLDTAKSAFTTLSQRVPTSTRPILQPALSGSSSAGGAVAASVTPSYTVKSAGPSVSQLSTLRHMVTPSATGVSAPNAGASPMASIIKGNTISTTQIGHSGPHQYSSHVPRGPAAVASINTAPKSALATPMLRSSMSQATTTPHIPVGQVRASGLVPTRASFASMPRSAGLSMAQVMDLQNGCRRSRDRCSLAPTPPWPRSGSHGGGGGQLQINFASGRSLEPLARTTTLGHSSVSIAKPLHVTQPIVHSLHQVPEKTFKCGASPATVQYTTVPGLATGTTGHSTVIPSSASALTTCSSGGNTSCGATLVSPHTQVVQPSLPLRGNLGTMSLVTLAPTGSVQSAPQVVATSQPGTLHGPGFSTGSSGIHPIFTVVSSKSPLSMAPTSTAPSLGLAQSRLGASHLSTSATPLVQPTSAQVAASASRPIATTVAIQPPSVSVPTGQSLRGHRPRAVSVVKTRLDDASKDDRRFAPGTKVFGSTSLVGSAGLHGGASLEAGSEATGNLFVTGTPASSRSLAPSISSASSNAATTTASMSATVVISDGRQADRPGQLQGTTAAASYAVPATYLYESYPIQGTTITMHPYAAPTPAGVTPVFPMASARPSRPHLMSGGSVPSSTATVVHPPQPLQQPQPQPQPQQQPTAAHIGALSLGPPSLGPSSLGPSSLGPTSLASAVVPSIGAMVGQGGSTVPLGAAGPGMVMPSAATSAAPSSLGNASSLAAVSLGAASPLGPSLAPGLLSAGSLGATAVRAPLMVAVDPSASRQQQQQQQQHQHSQQQQQQHLQQQAAHNALHAQQPSAFAPTGLMAHNALGNEGPVSTQASSLPAQPYSCATPSNLLSPTHSSTPPNHNTSPRPSILRKRTFESAHLSVKKNLMASLPGSEPASPRSEPPASLSTTSSPKPASDIQQESSNSSSTTSDPVGLPSEASKSSLPMVHIKQEPPDTCETPPNGTATPGLPNSVEASPRKKPRKQLLCVNELLDTHSTDGDDDIEKESRDNIKKEYSRGDEIKCVAFCKRPSMSLLTSYSHSWKTRQNHFVRHTDVKPKDDKKQTVNDLANQKGVLQKANGWKVFHLTSQMEEVFYLEDTVHNRLSELLSFIENEPPAIQTKPLNGDEERILSKINDLIKGNLQRSKIVQDQVTEAKQQVLKVLDHKPRIVEIIGKYVSKRPLKKREKM